MKKYLLFTTFLFVLITILTTITYALTPITSIKTINPTIIQKIITIPVSPSNLTATPSIINIILNWKDNSSNETGFKIERKIEGGSFILLYTTGSNITSYTDKSPESGKTYTYRVMAYNSAGVSAPSNEVQSKKTTLIIKPIDPNILKPIIIKPTAPAELKGNALSDSQISLSWQDKSSNESKFIIERKTSESSFSKIGETDQNINEYYDEELTENTAYTYRVKANNSNGDSAYSNEITLTTNEKENIIDKTTTINAPSNLKVELNENSIVLNWTDNSNNETGFSIEKKKTDGTYESLGTVEANSTAAEDTDIIKGNTYSYRIQAINDTTVSEYSNEISIEIPTKTEVEITDYPTASEWAIPEIKKAETNGLITDKVKEDFQQNITREEFCEIVVKLFESFNSEIQLTQENPFTDTDNINILKAYAAGIVKGKSSDIFAPQDSITRQEICVMITRALQGSFPKLDFAPTNVTKFADENKISSWAIKEIKFAFKNEIMKGVGKNSINPLGNTTREQAVALIIRTFEKFSSNK